MFRCTTSGSVVSANPAYRRYLWLTTDAALRHWLDLVGPEEVESANAWWDAARGGTGRPTLRVTLRQGDRWRVVVVRVAPILAAGRVAGYSGTLADVTEQYAKEEALRLQVERDPLTGLLNRAGFESALDTTFRHASDTCSPFAVAFLDLDRFKAVNDMHGHLVGDELLKQFGSRLKVALRDTDTVCRLAGDEFTLVLPGVGDVLAAELVGAKVVAAMQAPFVVGQVELAMTTSVGIAVFDWSSNCAPLTLVRVADELLYQAKAAGRNVFRVGTCCPKNP